MGQFVNININYYLILAIFLISFLLSISFTIIVRIIAEKFFIIDIPDSIRKIHLKPVPLMGGMAVFLTFFLSLLVFNELILSESLRPHHWLGVFFGAIILMVGGIIDDKYKIKPSLQIFFPIVASLFVIAGGVGIEKITNPLSNNLFFLDQIKIPILAWSGSMHYFLLIADSFTFIWLMGMMYTTKLLDGIDGLVTGVTGVGAFIIFLFTITTKYYQPDIAFASLILAAACFGFLLFNWHPASIFLGEGGSLLLGYLLGVLAIISGGKIAIALLIMGIPILDVAWTIIRRLVAKKNPFKFSDRNHLHFKLIDIGFSQRQAVLIYCTFSLFFGISALFLQSRGKTLALTFLLFIMAVIIIIISMIEKKKNTI